MELLTNTVEWGNPVNWNHPLNRGLVSWWLAVPGRAGFGSNRWRDLCKRHDGTLRNMDPATDWMARGLDFAEDNQYVDLGTNTMQTALAGTPSLTVHSRALWRSTTNNEGPLGFFLNNTLLFAAIRGVSDKFRIASRSSTADSLKSADSNTTIVGGTEYGITGTIDYAGGLIRVFVDGHLDGQNATPGFAQTSLTPSSSSNVDNLGTAGIPGVGGSLPLDGVIYSTMVWNRALSVGEAAELRRQEKQGYPGLLNRIWTPRVSVQEAAAAAQRRYRTLMGVGV